MAVVKDSGKESREQIESLKQMLKHEHGRAENFSRELAIAQKAQKENTELKAELDLLKGQLNASNARISSLEASLSAANASIGKAEQVIAAGKQINAALKLLG